MKKRLSLIMVMALVFSVLPICSFAAGNDPYFAGRGTKDDPFLIQTP